MGSGDEGTPNLREGDSADDSGTLGPVVAAGSSPSHRTSVNVVLIEGRQFCVFRKPLGSHKFHVNLYGPRNTHPGSTYSSTRHSQKGPIPKS